MTEFKKDVVFKAGFDKRHEKPNYGINGGTFLFVLSGPLGSVDFSFMTPFFPQETESWLIECAAGNPSKLVKSYTSNAGTIGYHSPKPHYEDHEPSSGDCSYIEGKKCYFQESYLLAEEVLAGFMTGGTKWLWDWLEKEYARTFIE